MKTGPHRTPFQRELHYTLLAREYAQGKTQAVMAEQLGITRSQVSHDLQVVVKRWREAANIDTADAKARELAKVDQLEREYWAAWERSKAPREETIVGNNETADGKIIRRGSKRTRDRDGNAEYLAGVQWCISERCKIFGLYAPTKIDVRHELEEFARTNAAALGLSVDEALEEVETVLREART